MSANLAQTQNKSATVKTGSQNSSGAQSNSQPRAPFNPAFGGRFGRGAARGGRGAAFSRGRGYYNNTSRPQCQLCGKTGHMAWQCFHRFNQQFISPFSQGAPRQQHPSNNFNFQSNPTAMMATSSSVFDASWYPDSGASNHITPDLSNITNRAAYNGTEQVYLADGTGISISHLGCAKVQQSHSSSSPLVLNHLLHVPSASKNLISVSKFASDNNIFFEFHPHLFCQMPGFQEDFTPGNC